VSALTLTPPPPGAPPTGAPLSGDASAGAVEVWAQLSFALDRTRVGVSVWDHDDRLIFSNPRFRELFAPYGPFDDKPHYSQFYDRARRLYRDQPTVLSAVDQRLRERSTRPATGEFLSGDNQVFRYQDIRTPDGGMVTLYQDVTREHTAEATLAALAKTIPGAIFELRQNPGGRVTCTYVSERIRELTGFGPDTFTGGWEDALAALMPEVEIDRLSESLCESAERQDDWNAEVPVRTLDGASRWLRAQASTRRLRDGTLLWSGLLTDATRTVESNAALAESERRFRDIIDIASDWIWESDSEGRIIFVSDRFAQSTGVPIEDVVGRTRREMPQYDCNDPGFQALEEDILLRRPIHSRRLRMLTPSGHRQVSLRGRPIFDDSGTFLGYRGAGSDVSREHDYVQRLQDAMLEAQSANQAKSRFLANMSHDLRTPLNAIMGFSEIIQAEVFGAVGHPRYAEYIRDIRASAAHLLELIDDLLDLARIEAGRLEMVEETMNVADLVDEAMVLVAPRCEARGVALSKTCALEAPVISSDRRAVKQILVNLLTNASKFTDRGGLIEVAIDADGADGLWVTVRDDGCGIPASMIAEVTKPFVQAHGSGDRPRDGVGLGLAIVRSLTDAIGAEFRIESRIGDGTRAAFRLPARRAARTA